MTLLVVLMVCVVSFAIGFTVTTAVLTLGARRREREWQALRLRRLRAIAKSPEQEAGA